MLKKISESYCSGELDCLKESILPFLKMHIQELESFIQNFQSGSTPQPLEFLIKYFILSFNRPFDMKQYLETQTEVMVQDIGPDIDSNRRKQLMFQWIKDKAANYRSYSIMQQVYCFEQVKDEVVPEVRKLLSIDVG